MNTSPSRLLVSAALACAAAISLTSCAASQSASDSIAAQKQQVVALTKLVPAANRDGALAITGGTSKDQSGSYFPCSNTERQFVTGRVQDVKGLTPQPFVEGLKPKLEAQGYKTSWYNATPRKLVADKDGSEFWFATTTDKRDAKNPKPAIVITSFGKCYPVGK